MKTAVGIGAAALVAFASALAFAPRTPPSLAPTTIGVERTHFNAITQVGDRILTVGAMGEILYSDERQDGLIEALNVSSREREPVVRDIYQEMRGPNAARMRPDFE